MPYINILKNPSSVSIYALVICEGVFILGSFSFMEGGGVGTAIGGNIVAASSFENRVIMYGVERLLHN